MRSWRSAVVLALLFAFSAPSLPAQTAFAPAIDTARKPPPQAGHPLLPGIWRLYGNDPQLATDDDLEPLRRIVGKASVVALGESIHTSGGYYKMKHRVFRFLVEKMGFRVFAFESPRPGAEEVAAYVQTCTGTPEEAVQGLFGVWQSAETRDLVQWMCEWNRTHRQAKDKLSFFGFDVQQPDVDGASLLAYLERIGVASGHPWVTGVQACDGVTGPPFNGSEEVSPESHVQCTQALQEIDTYFRQNARTLQRRTTKKDFELAKVFLVGVRAWQDSVFYFDDLARSYSARDVGMAYAFQTLRSLRFPKAKVVVWAHNSHIARAPLATGEVPMGTHLAAALGSSYANFALVAFQADIDWRGIGCGPASRPTQSTVEQPLHELDEEALLVDLRFPGTSDPYLPRGEYSFGTRRGVPHDLYTGIFYLDHSAKMEPLAWPSCQ